MDCRLIHGLSLTILIRGLSPDKPPTTTIKGNHIRGLSPDNPPTATKGNQKDIPA